MKMNALREQNEKLQGSIKILKATNEDLSVTCERLDKEKKKWKDAFETIFTNNIGARWEEFEDKQKNKMSVDDKIIFFSKEINYSKLYIRSIMEQRIEALKAELLEAKRQADEAEAELKKLRSGIPDLPRDEEGDGEERTDASSKKSENGLTDKNNIFEASNGKPNLKRNSDEKMNHSSGMKKALGSALGISGKQSSENEEKPKEKPYKKINYVAVLDKMNRENKLDPLRQKMIAAQKQIKPEDYGFFKEICETGNYSMKQMSSPMQYLTKKRLVEAGFLQDLERISIGGVNFIPFAITDLGGYYYAMKEKKNPLESQYLAYAKDQKSGEHALGIQMLIEILEEYQYECKQEDKMITVDGRESICDVLAKKNGQFFRIEYEVGNYNMEDYMDKFRRVWGVTDYLIVVTANMTAKNTIEEAINELVASDYHGVMSMRKEGKGYLLLTLTELKKDPNKIVKDAPKK